MTQNGLLIALGTLLLASAPANAEVGTGTAQTKAAASADVSKEKKYCLKEALTGTRMSSKTCKTKEEWARGGVDVGETSKNK